MPCRRADSGLNWTAEPAPEAPWALPDVPLARPVSPACAGALPDTRGGVGGIFIRVSVIGRGGRPGGPGHAPSMPLSAPRPETVGSGVPDGAQRTSTILPGRAIPVRTLPPGTAAC